MTFLLRTLSLSYARRHKAKTLLTLLGVVVGVATFSAIGSARGTLLRGIRDTVDRMAGKAQLQITLEGGVPEEVQERIREIPGIRAQSPVIEQIVVPERGELGSILFLGVDLLGDREMRDYGFEGEDADLDDPLLFLAQPDSVAVARPLAARAGLKPGDTFAFRAAQGLRQVVVRGLLTPKGFAEAFGGNLVVTDVFAAQTLFGRGRRFDRVEVRLEDGVTLARATATLQAALGPAYRVETPDRRGAQLERLVSNFVAGFNISSGFSLGIGTFLIFNAFHVAVNRRRRDIGTLRSLGATPRQVQALFLAEALAVGAAGGVLGCLAGAGISQSFLRMMGQTTDTIYGVAGSGEARLTIGLALQSIGLGVLASLVGAWGPARAASRISPTEAFAKGVFQARLPRAQTVRLAAGGLALGSAVALALRPPVAGSALMLSVLATGGGGVVLLVGPVARAVLSWFGPFLTRLAPVAGRLSSDALLGNPRRTSGTLMAMTLSLAFVLGLGGYMNSTKATIVRWMDDVLTSELYVRASASFARPDYRFPGSLRDELLGIQGVRAVESYRAARIGFRGDTILLASIEIGPLLDRTRHEFLQGDEETMRRGLTREGKCAVSDNFFRRFGLGMGDVLDLPAPGGLVRLSIAAVFRDFSSDRGTVFIDRSLFLSLWKDDRVDIYDVNLFPQADPGGVRDAIRAHLEGRMPALLSTRREFAGEIGKAIDAFYSLVQITVLLALAVAFLGIVTSLLISVAERTREIGILKALGALAPQLRRSVTLEALTLAFTGLALAIPAGLLLSLFMETTLAEVYAGWRMPHRYPWPLLSGLILALPAVSALAGWVPARQAARVKVTEAITYE